MVDMELFYYIGWDLFYIVNRELFHTVGWDLFCCVNRELLSIEER